VAQSAAVITSVAGVAMIMLARGLRRGQRRAWFFAVTVLAVTIVSHVLRGGSLVAVAVSVGVLLLLVTQRHHFQAATDRTSLRAAAPNLLLIAFIAVLGGALGIEATTWQVVHHHLRHHHPANWPNFGQIVLACAERLVGQYDVALPDRVADFADPVLLTVGLSLVIATLYLLTRPVVDRRLSAKGSGAERRLAELRAREIVRRHGRGTLDYFALRDDKQFFFFRDSLVAYAVYGGVALISPDPIGPEAERAEVFSAFKSFAEGRGWTLAVMGASAEWLPVYTAAGFHHLYLGDEAIVDVQHFSLEGGKMKGLRQACTRLARHGYTVEYYDPATIDPAHVLDVLELISMLRRGEDERGFSMMLGRLFDPRDKGLLLTIVRGPDGRPAAACQFVPSPALHGYSLDLMRRDPGEHPNGLIDYALCSTIAHLKEQGAQGLSLNFAAFRGVLEGERGEGVWTRVERWTLKRLSGVLPIESLWTFNAKYQPTWLPRHVVYPAVENFVPVVSAIMRAESLTEFPVIGRFLANDPSRRPGTITPDEVLAAAKRARRD
jgi:lysyl-tRNA synthetase class 2